MFVYAISVTMIAPIMPVIIRQYALRLSQGGLTMTFQNIGGVLAIALGVVVADKIKKTRLVVGCFFLYCLILIAIGLAPPFWMLLTVFFLLGATTRLLDTVINALVADLHPKRRGLFINLLHTVFGVGALAGPIYARFLMSRNIPWNHTFQILGFICSGILLMAALIKGKSNVTHGKDHNSTDPGNIPHLLVKSKLLALCFIMLMYVAHQTGITTWLPMYMEDSLGTTPFTASLALSIFWLGIILGRLTSSILSNRINPILLIMWGCLGGGVLLTAGVLSNNASLIIVLAGITGFLTGAVIPLLITVTCTWYPNNSGTVSSMIFINGAVAGMLFPWLIGLIAEYFSFQTGMLVTGITLLIAFITASLLS